MHGIVIVTGDIKRAASADPGPVGGAVLDRLVGGCLALLAAAAAVYVAVRLIETIAGALLVGIAVLGALIIASCAARLWWRNLGRDRW